MSRLPDISVSLYRKKRTVIDCEHAAFCSPQVLVTVEDATGRVYIQRQLSGATRQV